MGVVGRREKYKVVIQLDDLTPWDAEATGFRFKTVRPGVFVLLNINFKNPDFLEKIMRRNLFKLKYKNHWVSRLKLKGSYTAGQEILKCQSEIRGTQPQASKDLFSVKPAKSDPFSQ